MATVNEEMAAGTGQEKSDHEPIDVYDSKHGHYEDKKPSVNASGTTKSTVQPFGSLK